MRSIPSYCEYRGGRAGNQVQCNKPAKFVCPDGEVRTLLLFHGGLFIGPCHWHMVGRYGSHGPSLLDQQAGANWPDYPKDYKPYEPTIEEAKLKQQQERRFRWTLTETMPQRQGGLKRMDNSAAGDVVLPYIPTPAVRKV